jgi:hypothetical protein
MRRADLSYYRDERARLAERRADVQRETAAITSRLVELEREDQLLSELLKSLDAHVPVAVEAVTDIPQRRIGAGNAA